MSRRRLMGGKSLVYFEKRFFPGGSYVWNVPEGCTSIDVFCVGGGGRGSSGGGGGGGYTATTKSVSVTPGLRCVATVGSGATPYNSSTSGASYFELNGGTVVCRAEGGKNGDTFTGGDGGSGGSSRYPWTVPGSDGSNGSGPTNEDIGGRGQGTTTRDFGEPTGKRNAGGGGGFRTYEDSPGGVSDYTGGRMEGCGDNFAYMPDPTGANDLITYGGGGYGGGGGGAYGSGVNNGGIGGDGTILIRGYSKDGQS